MNFFLSRTLLSLSMTTIKSSAKPFLTCLVLSCSIGNTTVYSINLFLPFVTYSSCPLQWRLFSIYLLFNSQLSLGPNFQFLVLLYLQFFQLPLFKFLFPNILLHCLERVVVSIEDHLVERRFNCRGLRLDNLLM